MLYAAVKKKARRLYFPFLRSLVSRDSFFPRSIPFKKINPNQEYHSLKDEVASLREHAKGTKGRGYTLDLKAVESRRYGTQSLPRTICFETEEDFLVFLGNRKSTEGFKRDLALINAFPELRGWAYRNVRKVLDYHGAWPDLLKVVRYFCRHPRPRCYIRELPVAVPTKFIEQHQGILKSLLDEILPEDQVNSRESSFERRYGLRYDEDLIRVRFLDQPVREDLAITDISLPVSQAHMIPQQKKVFMVENKMNFLTFPSVRMSLAVWTRGFNVRRLEHLPWLREADMIYWGDCDVQGFQILSLVRSLFPQTRSFLMDYETFDAYQFYKVEGRPTKTPEPALLTEREKELYARLARDTVRLEQERIGHDYVVKRLAEIVE